MSAGDHTNYNLKAGYRVEVDVTLCYTYTLFDPQGNVVRKRFHNDSVEGSADAAERYVTRLLKQAKES